jgi:transposase
MLAFLDDYATSFNNNRAERDLRILKVQQKVPGCFRCTHGGTAFSGIKSYTMSHRSIVVCRRATMLRAVTGVESHVPME